MLMVNVTQWPRDTSAADVSSRQDIRTHRNEGIPTAEAGSGGYSAYRGSVGIGRRRGRFNHGMSDPMGYSDETGKGLER